MSFIYFHEVLPEVAHRETRTMMIGFDGLPLPKGGYTFHESYCADPSCDCRRVMLDVVSVDRRRVEAVINFGWESAAFYGKWMRTKDRKLISDLQGPLLNPGSPCTELAPAALDLFREVMMEDDAYIARLESHYYALRAKLSGPLATVIPIKKPGRNDPCPCGSGRKWKACCGRP